MKDSEQVKEPSVRSKRTVGQDGWSNFRNPLVYYTNKPRITKMADLDRDFVEYVVKQIVNNPDAVKVERKIDEMGVLITLDVAPEDMGMVIGREGATAKALRTLLRVIGAKNNARVNLKINEPDGSERKPREQRSIDDVVGGIEV
jgi:predicted RNA-binding protein YlqC (UPF0109 family)